MTRPFFAKERISDFEMFNKHSDHLLSTIRRLSTASGGSFSHSKGAIEIQDLFGRFTLDAAIEFLMGGSLVRVDGSTVIIQRPDRSLVNSNHSPTSRRTRSRPTPCRTASSVRRVFPSRPSVLTLSLFLTGSFNMAQENVFLRSRYGLIWPVFELRGSKNEVPMKVRGVEETSQTSHC